MFIHMKISENSIKIEALLEQFFQKFWVLRASFT